MIYGSVCSGIEAATVAWHPLGWKPAFFSEIESFPRAVLAHHYPETPLHGDFTTIGADQYGPIDLLVGGTPCQSFSIAGLRGGLDDERGNLALEFLRLAQRTRAKWLVWENVPGVLSSNGGRDFGAILGGMVELGYGFAYRVLDAQFFGVAQRRRRVFVVGYLGDWRPPAAVLFERESLSGHPAPRREAGKAAPTIPSRSTGGGGLGTDFDLDGGVIAIQERAVSENPDAGPQGRGYQPGLAYTLEARNKVQSVAYAPIICPAIKARDYKGPSSDGLGDGAALVTIAFDTTQMTSAANRSNPQPGDPCHPLAAGAHAPAVAFSIMPMNSGKDFKGRETDIAQPVMAAGPAGGNQGGDYVVQPLAAPVVARSLTRRHDGSPCADRGPDVVVHQSAVRRLTPRECERLQGFPDDYTLIPWRRGMAPDGPRYKALGNSMAVPVMAWIGRRIEAVENIITRSEAA